MTPKELMNEKKLSALEEAAKMNTHIHYTDEIYPLLSEIKDVVSDMEQSFIDGAQWQKNNMWFDIKKDGYPEYEKSNNLALKKYIVRAECENMCIKESVTISFLINPCKFNIEMNSNIAKVRVTHWMPIPEFNIKT